MSIHGDIESFSIAGREFNVIGGSGATLNKGGYSGERQSNGNGTSRQLLKRVPWSLKGLILEIDFDREDLEFIQSTLNRGVDEDISVTYVDGTTYSGSGCFQGEINYKNDTGAVETEVAGSGEMVKQ